MTDIVYFELCDWTPQEDFPVIEPFLSWFWFTDSPYYLCFRDNNWAIKNQLCIKESTIDMALNLCISAKRDWVEKNCPEILTKYKEFLRFPDKDGKVYGRFGHTFLEYNEKNMGYTYNED